MTEPPTSLPSGAATAPAELEAPARQLLERSAAAIAMTRLDGRILYVNPAFVALWGFADAAQVLGRSADAVFWTDPAQARRAQQALGAQHAWQGELAARRADGAALPLWCSAHLVRAGDGRPPSMVLSFVGRSAEAGAPGARDGERRRAGAVTDGADAARREAQPPARPGAWELDLVSGRLTCPDPVCALFEIDCACTEATHAALRDRIHPDDRRAVDAACARALASRQAYVVEYRLSLPDGRIKWVEERGHGVYDEAGRPLRSVGSVQDVTDRHRRDADLRRFRHMVERASQEVWLTDAATRIRYVNDAAAASLGYTPDELMRLSLGDIDAAGPASVAEQIQRIAAQAADGGVPQPFQVVHRARDGRLVPKEVRPTLFELDGESFRCSFAQDISERLRAKATLDAAEAQLRATLDAFPGWVACVDDDLRYVYVNEALCRRVGRPREDVLGRSVDELRGPEVSAELREVRRRLRAGEPVQLERRHPGAAVGGERIFWVHYRLADDLSAPGRQLLYAYGTDITEPRQALLRLNTIVERTGIGLWEWNTQADTLQFNAQFPIVVGYALGERPADLRYWLRTHVHPEDRPARKAQLQSVLGGATDAFESEFRARHRDGRWVWLLERGRVVSFTPDGKPLLLIGTLQDVTKLKSHEQALRRLNEELEDRVERRTRELALAKADAERASAAKSEFLSRMSHELRTPLNAILGFGQLLQLAPLQRGDDKHVQEIVRAGRHLLELINEVLDLATVESGRMALTSETVALPALVDDCLALMRPLALAADLQLQSRLPPDGPAVRADRGRLRQVLLNLLSNAVKYNRPAGRVAVECDGRPGADGQCEIRVVDTGRGLGPAQIERLFQPFERLDAARSAIQGTGIGLSVSKRLVELMGGQIGVRSEPGQGSCFWVRLPVVDTPMAPAASAARVRAEPPAATTRATAAPATVLYFEDDPADQRLMEQVLAWRSDLALVCSADPSAAVVLARQARPVLVLLDIQLPRLDGYEVLGRLRAAGVGVPVVAVSADAAPADVARGLEAGFVAYLTKPLDVQRVRAVLATCLPVVNGADTGR